MYCIECGKQLEGTDKFCASCGTARSVPQPELQAQPELPSQPELQPQHEAQPQMDMQPQTETQPQVQLVQPVQPQQAYGYAPQPPKPPKPPLNSGSSTSTMKIVLGVGIPVFAVAAALIILFAAGVFGNIFEADLTGNFTGILRINRDAVPIADALDIMIEEAGLRMETTPFQVFPLMYDILADGTLSVNFDHRDDGLWGFGSTRGSVVLRSDTTNSEFAIEADLNAMGFIVIDFAAFFNNDRLAFGSSLLGGDYFGITYSTFAEDFRIFGNAIGLSPDVIDDIASSVEGYFEMYTTEPDIDISVFEIAQYTIILSNFIRNLEFVSENSTLAVGGEQTNATRISTVITTGDLFALLADLLEVAEGDDRFTPWTFGDTFDGGNDDSSQIFRDALDELRTLGEEVHGDFSFAFYIGQDGRLLRVVADIDYVDGDVSTYSTTTINFGASYRDNWTLDVTTISLLDSSNITLSWDIDETSQGYRHSLALEYGSRLFSHSYTLTSLWAPDTGRFTLSYLEHRWNDSGSISGILNLEPDSFTILFDDFELGMDQFLSLEIVSERDANIPQIDYINLDRWDQSLINIIEDWLRTFGFDGFGLDDLELW